MKIIFLDVDGVLNNENSLKRDGTLSIDKENWDNFKKILKAHLDAQVVISSTWRLHEDRHQKCLLDLCKSENIPLHKDWRTPHVAFKFREFEIHQWMFRNNFIPEFHLNRFVILDDVGEIFFHFKENLIQTSFSIGLQDFDAQHAIELLK